MWGELEIAVCGGGPGGLITKGGNGFYMWPAERLEGWDMDHGVPAMGLINGVKLMVLYLYACF